MNESGFQGWICFGDKIRSSGFQHRRLFGWQGFSLPLTQRVGDPLLLAAGENPKMPGLLNQKAGGNVCGESVG